MVNFRVIVVRVVVASFSMAALLGVAALLGADALGDTGDDVLATTFTVGVESLAVLCYLTVMATRWAILGVIGGVISFVPFVIAVWLIWGGDVAGDMLWRVFGVGATVAASLAQACLLSIITSPAGVRARVIARATYLAVAVLAAMIVYAILVDHEPGEWYWRVLGIVAIADALGTILMIASYKFIASSAPRLRRPSRLSAATQDRLNDLARQRGITPSALLDELLDRLPDP